MDSHASHNQTPRSGSRDHEGAALRPARDTGAKRNKRTSGSTIDEQLKEIYGNRDGTMPDMKHFEKQHQSRVVRAFVTLFFSCLFLAGVVWGGFFLFQPNGRFSEADVILSVAAPESVAIGEEVQYRIRYRNAQDVPLSRVRLEARYPSGFTFVTSTLDPINEAGSEWALGSLDAGESGYIDLVGTLSGDVAEEQSLRVFLNYTPANFSSEFQKVAAATTVIGRSPVALVVTGPEEAVPGQEVSFTVTAKKDGARTVPPMRLLLETGGVFHKKSSSPESVPFREYEWDLGTLDTEATVVVTGVFDASAPSVSPLAFSLQSREGAGAAGHTYGAATHVVQLGAPRSAGTLAVNGVSGDTALAPGETMAVRVTFKNTGNEPVEHVVARAIFDAPSNEDRSILRWADVENKYGGDIVGEQLSPTVRRGSIRWTEDEVAGLAKLEPGQEVVIDMTLPVKGTDETDYSTFAGFTILAVAEFTYEEGGKTVTAASRPITLSVNSDLALDVRHEAANGGAEVHRITWLLSNSLHDLSDVRLEADVYGTPVFDEQALSVPAGTAAFDAARKKMVWTIPNITTAVDVLALQFTLTLAERNPTQTTLVSKVRLSAKDGVTGKEIVKTGSEVRL